MKLLILAGALAIGGTAFAQTTSAPGNTAPEVDARGIPVVSAPATVPSGWNEGPRTGTADNPPAPANPTTTMPAATDLPPCSRTVTDRCTQTYERSRSPR